MVKLTFCLLLLLPGIVSAQTGTDTIKLYFDIGIASLNPSEQYKLDSLIYYNILQPGKKLGITGYADYLGSEKANVALSERRANNIKAYLLSMGIADADIQLVAGKGEITRAVLNGTDGYQEDRRVDIIPGGFHTEKLPPQPPAAKAPEDPIDLGKMKKNETIRLVHIHFIGGSHQWLETSLPALRSLLAALKQHPKVKVRIEGHVCCLEPHMDDGLDVESGAYNLSETRAKAVYDYLVQNGIDPARLEHKGFGRAYPLRDPERTAEDRIMNRRVEIRILEK